MEALKPNFKNQKTTIMQLPDNKWSLQVGCPAYRFIFDTPQEMLIQYAKCLSDPEGWFEENKVAMGNKILKDVDLDVIINYLKQTQK
jgi:hypothetical protein